MKTYALVNMNLPVLRIRFIFYMVLRAFKYSIWNGPYSSLLLILDAYLRIECVKKWNSCWRKIEPRRVALLNAHLCEMTAVVFRFRVSKNNQIGYKMTVEIIIFRFTLFSIFFSHSFFCHIFVLFFGGVVFGMMNRMNARELNENETLKKKIFNFILLVVLSVVFSSSNDHICYCGAVHMQYIYFWAEHNL